MITRANAMITVSAASRAARRTAKLSGAGGTMLGMDAIALLIALVTLAAGFAAGWALARGRSAAALAERAAARDELARPQATHEEHAPPPPDERERIESRLREAQTAAADATARLESERASSADKIVLL